MTKAQIKTWNKKLREPFKDLKFYEEGHRYEVVTNPGKPIKSVSSLIKYFYEEFDTDTMAENWSKSRKLPIEFVKAAWTGEGDIANTHGSKVHLIGENYVKHKFLGDKSIKMIPDFLPIDKQSLGAIQFIEDLPDYLIPVAVELPMYNELFWFCGTCDGILFNTKNGKLIIYDYKGLPLNTPIFTNNGWKTMGTLNINDYVYDKDGKLVRIKNISDIKNKKCIKFTFDNNEEIISDYEHRWLINKGFSKKGKVFTSQEVFDYLNSNDISKSYLTLKIYNPKALDNKHSELPIDPYVLGIWLGDGHKADAKITQMNSKVWEEIEKRGYSLGKDVSKGSSGKAQTRTIFGLQKELRELNLLKNKHLPDIYLLASYEQRLDLLRGFMDADGYFNKTRKRFVMTTTKRYQVSILTKLLGSLGIKSTVISKVAVCNGKKFDAWDICFTECEFNPFLCRNEDIDLSQIKNSQHTYRKIIKAEEVDSIPTICIEVDSPSHTFLYGESFIVTHNTNKTLTGKYGKSPLFKINPDRKLTQNNFGKYTLQFSFYQILLEQAGFEVQSRVLVHLQEDEKTKKLYKTYKTQNVTEELLEWLKTGEHLD